MSGKQAVEKIIHARWVITCEEQNRTYDNYALVIQDGKIKDILASDAVDARYQSQHVEHYPNHALLPGFINTHTHVPMSYLRGLADDLALMNWLQNYIWPAEKKWVDANYVYDASKYGMAEMLRSGTTCFNDMYFFMPATAKATAEIGMRGFMSIHVIDFPTNWAKDADEEFAKGLAFYHEYKSHPLIGITVAPHAIYTVSEPNLIRSREIAEELNLQINMHIQETADEVNQSMTQTGKRPLKRLQQIGLITPRLIAVHMTQLDAEDLAILEEGKPNIVHCPLSNMKLASGTAPVSLLKSMGLNVAIGSDSNASNNDLNMLGEMRIASLLAKLSTGNPENLPAEEVLKMATLHGAKALKIDHITGSLTVGKAADMIAIDLSAIETTPTYHPISQIVYAASRQQVSDVWVAGKQLLKKRQLTTMDEAELLAKAKEWGQKIKPN